MKEQPIIDAHAILGSEYHLHLEPSELLRRMDAHQIETAIARPSGAELAVFNTQGNNGVLLAHARIKGLATVNPWYGEQALKELERCRELNAVGLFLHPSRQGFMPTDNLVEPILDRAGEMDWPVMFHTGSYIQSDVLALAEVAHSYPNLNFIAGFGGFTDMWFELPGVFADTPNLFLDASMMWGEAIQEIVHSFGAERVLFGSAEPRGRYGAVLNTINRLGLSPQEVRLLLCDNARRLFKLP